MKQLLSRVFSGLLFAVPLTFAPLALARADTAAQPPDPKGQECRECHGAIQNAWAGGAHSQALADPVFAAAWDAQGQPGDCLRCHTTGYNPLDGTYAAEGVTCAACHTPVTNNHPLSPAAVSRSAELCGKCHTDTFFEWQASRHGQSELKCVSCHDAHTASLRAADTSTLCASCHGTRVDAFAHSTHASEGLTCTDCHIGEPTGPVGMGRSLRSHSFDVDLNTCTRCHAYDIHKPNEALLAVSGATPPPPDSMSSGLPKTAMDAPSPVSPMGYSILTGLIGLAAGIVLAPWLEKGFRRFIRSGGQGDTPREVRL